MLLAAAFTAGNAGCAGTLGYLAGSGVDAAMGKRVIHQGAQMRALKPGASVEAQRRNGTLVASRLAAVALSADTSLVVEVAGRFRAALPGDQGATEQLTIPLGDVQAVALARNRARFTGFALGLMVDIVVLVPILAGAYVPLSGLD